MGPPIWCRCHGRGAHGSRVRLAAGDGRVHPVPVVVESCAAREEQPVALPVIEDGAIDRGQSVVRLRRERGAGAEQQSLAGAEVGERGWKGAGGGGAARARTRWARWDTVSGGDASPGSTMCGWG